MVLNYIFIGFFAVALLIALGTLCFTGDFSVFERVMSASFEQSKNGFEIALYLTGVLSLWLGFLKIAERSGLIDSFARLVSPVLRVLFPSIPEGHPALGNIFMNISANVLGLDNAATPLGLKTMNSLQELNEKPSEPSDAMNMFIALNASGLTIIPTSIIAFRMQAGAVNPADVFIPILAATTTSTLVVMILVGLKQGINLLARPLLMLYGAIALLFGGIIYAAQTVPLDTFSRISAGISAMILVVMMSLFVFAGLRKKLNVYDLFVEGAKEGFTTAVGIIPYLIAMLVGIGVFRASGAMDLISSCLSYLVALIGFDTAWVEALPTMLMKPLSGSGARGLMVDAMQTHGADSFVGRLACTVQGAADTTFYVIALYLGSIGIRKSGYVLGHLLIADAAGMLVAVLMSYLFFM